MTISNCCGAATRHNPDPQSTSGLLCVKCKLNCCEQKPMKHVVKVGSSFRLGHWEWVVRKVQDDMFFAYEKEAWLIDHTRELRLLPHDADKLDWIKPEVTFTQEQVEVLKGQIQHIFCSCKNDHDAEDMFIDFLDSHTEEDKPLE